MDCEERREESRLTVSIDEPGVLGAHDRLRTRENGRGSSRQGERVGEASHRPEETEPGHGDTEPRDCRREEEAPGAGAAEETAIAILR
ncbi:hypothetical protein GCM10025867_36470 [Frondihabitans sucicola]|uniref:Uncharacterized protein n=1 Tax=Frondihabitans sucicola TaxID=1268041 RepID=A0ABN6Y5Y9_9MICO|nr:hypothetical protein GCM10025867_36470 [Frondihabitans sucicola]